MNYANNIFNNISIYRSWLLNGQIKWVIVKMRSYVILNNRRWLIKNNLNHTQTQKCFDLQ